MTLELLNRPLEAGARLEGGALLGRNLDRVARLRVASLASWPLDHAEGAETADSDFVTLLERVLDGRENSGRYLVDLRLGHAGRLCNVCDEFLLSHCSSL